MEILWGNVNFIASLLKWFDSSQEIIEEIKTASYILNTIPPIQNKNRSVDIVRMHHPFYLDLKQVLHALGEDSVALLSHVHWIGNLSSTSDLDFNNW